MNNIEDMQKAFEGQKFKVFSPFKCDISKNEDGNYVDDTTIFAFAWFCRGIASQAQQTTPSYIKIGSQYLSPFDGMWYDSDGLADNEPESATVRYLYIKIGSDK